MTDTLNLDRAIPTLTEEFDRLLEWRRGCTQVDAKPLPLNDPGFNWAAGYVWNHPIVGPDAPKEKWPAKKAASYPAWTSNLGSGAVDVCPNGDMIRRMGRSLGPFDLSGSQELLVSAKPLPAYLAKTVGPQDRVNGAAPAYMGGAFVSFPYSQTFGVFEMRARIAKGKGLWPAFWLLPCDHSWPPEIDVMEVLGKSPETVVSTLHFKDPSGKHKQASGILKGADLSLAVHDYAVDWGPEVIRFYLDGRLFFTHPTPASMKKPHYLIVDHAVGGPKSWPGAPDATTKFPAQMRISHIRAWQRPEYL
ncbi:glycoside hydrolase family 16 protein [Tautonia marina]|uniref:glycoside hydrolase family 16 protein n=1 Tax=Tautonia marina TaxID=2653855 RepID=UPI00137595F4|nr:glycoside hydrolase family 16 protein [Tautonia marina]